MTTKNLLVELFVEELPPKALKKLGESFGNTLFSELQKANGLDSNAVLTTYASPRRLAAHITNVFSVAASKPVKVRLMPVSVALDAEGMPTPALKKKLESIGLEYLLKVNKSVWDARISREGEGKNESLFHSDVAAGMHLYESLQIALNQALAKLPIPKVMGYQLADGWSTVNFVRPAHGLVALHGSEIVPIAVLGLNSGNTTQGHRFEAANLTVMLKSADSYAEQLETEGAVIASFENRRAEIQRQLFDAANKQNLVPIQDDALLDEVTALVERPNVLLGQFEETFLEVPQECLILTMKANQKYFPLLDASGKLTNKFLIVSNIRPTDPSLVVGGNERVVRPRLADAKFFFDQDRKKPLDARVLGLSKVVYHNKLGTQGQRVERVRWVAVNFAAQFRPDDKTFMASVRDAATLAKADLLTDMVGEFPELQGIMGRYYALNDGLPIDVANAIEDHYKPRFSGDELPRGLTATIAALADKMVTLVDMFGIGQLPTGDKDPFALRRHALGVIRILIEQDLPIGVKQLIDVAETAWLLAEGQQVVALLATTPQQLADFIYDRLAGSLREQGYSVQEVDAVLALRPQRLGEVPKRLVAVRAFAALPEAKALAAANKRVSNILKKAESEIPIRIDDQQLEEDAEKELASALHSVRTYSDGLFDNGDYTESLQELAKLKEPVDAFFDSVMVNAEDPALRANRLALLAQLHAAMNRVADLSKLAA